VAATPDATASVETMEDDEEPVQTSQRTGSHRILGNQDGRREFGTLACVQIAAATDGTEQSLLAQSRTSQLP
jgi:hypothetical protein